MLNRLVILSAAVFAFALIPAASASAISPWWQVLPGSRPANLPPAKDATEVQEFKTEKVFGIFAAKVEVAGQVVGCLGSGEIPGFKSADELCEEETSFAADETAAQLQTTLEGPYGAGVVEVAGGPIGSPAEGGSPFLVTTPGRWVPPIELSFIQFGGIPLGSAETRFASEGSGHLVLTLTNLGDAPVDGTANPVTITDSLPAGLSAYNAIGVAGACGYAAKKVSQPCSSSPVSANPVDCTVAATSSVVCTFAGTLPTYEAIEIEVYVSAAAGPPASGTSGEVTVSGGGAPSTGAAQVARIDEAATPFGVEAFSADAEQEGGTTATQAGSHPFQFTTTLQLNQGAVTPGTQRPNEVSSVGQPALPRNLRFELPAGLVGNATVLPRCTYSDFVTQEKFVNRCPPSTAIGVASVTAAEPGLLGLLREAVPVFNLPPSRGEPARFGFMALGDPVVIDTALDAEDGYRIFADVNNVTQGAQFLASTVTLWGNPGDQRHDSSRGWDCVYHEPLGPCAAPNERQGAAFLRLPGSCGPNLAFGLELEPWNVPLGSDVVDRSFVRAGLDGCNRLPFEPTIEVEADTHAPETPSGLNVALKVPQEPSEAPNGIAESDVRNTKVTLPSGLHVNPAAANGLQACSEGQVGFRRIDAQSGEAVFDEAAASCPEASKLGTVKITTPLLEEPLTGSVYQAAQGANPFNSLLALYVVADAPKAGVHVKLAGKVVPTASGQLVSTFDVTPQLPFEEFELSFFGGAGAPLATSTCGAYRTETQIEPWSAAAAATPSSEFQVSGCPNPQPFAPAFSAGTVSPLAGSYSPFVLNLSRADGTQQFSRIDTVLPPGLLGKLAGIPYCPEAAIAQARGRSNPGEGATEQAAPSCPPASQVGTVTVGTGVGPNPYDAPGKVYLAGPYKGAPLSLAIITPAVAGPFDLGNVVVRVALEVNPVSTQITAVSDPIPTILQGIPLDVRSIVLKMDRPTFTLNPTSCERMAVSGTATSILGQAAVLTSPFQVGGCGGLAFKPGLKLRLKGGTTRHKFPALKAVVTYPKKGNYANIARAQVGLPHSEFLEQVHIGTICTRVQFAAGASPGEKCPAASVYGKARAFSPLLAKPLEGPVFLRSSNHELPDLVANLKGQINVVLDGRIDSHHGGIRTTFEAVPDAPISRFVLEMRGGKKGLLTNSTNICQGKNRATASFTGQNGKIRSFSPLLVAQCGKKHSHMSPKGRGGHRP
jgi:hypothetical protein